MIARIYAAEWDTYAVYDSIYDAFGSQPFWWASVGLGLGTLVTIELVAQSLRRVLLPTDVDLFQELEKDGRLRAGLERWRAPVTSSRIADNSARP